MQGDYRLPCIILSTEIEVHIGVWGERHRRYLKAHHRGRYYNLLTAGKLNNYLADVNQQAEKMFAELVKSLAEKEDVTEILKTDSSISITHNLPLNNTNNRTKVSAALHPKNYYNNELTLLTIINNYKQMDVKNAKS